MVQIQPASGGDPIRIKRWSGPPFSTPLDDRVSALARKTLTDPVLSRSRPWSKEIGPRQSSAAYAPLKVTPSSAQVMVLMTRATNSSRELVSLLGNCPPELAENTNVVKALLGKLWDLSHDEGWAHHAAHCIYWIKTFRGHLPELVKVLEAILSLSGYSPEEHPLIQDLLVSPTFWEALASLPEPQQDELFSHLRVDLPSLFRHPIARNNLHLLLEHALPVLSSQQLLALFRDAELREVLFPSEEAAPALLPRSAQRDFLQRIHALLPLLPHDHADRQLWKEFCREASRELRLLIWSSLGSQVAPTLGGDNPFEDLSLMQQMCLEDPTILKMLPSEKLRDLSWASQLLNTALVLTNTHRTDSIPLLNSLFQLYSPLLRENLLHEPTTSLQARLQQQLKSVIPILGVETIGQTLPELWFLPVFYAIGAHENLSLMERQIEALLPQRAPREALPHTPHPPHIQEHKELPDSFFKRPPYYAAPHLLRLHGLQDGLSQLPSDCLENSLALGNLVAIDPLLVKVIAPQFYTQELFHRAVEGVRTASPGGRSSDEVLKVLSDAFQEVLHQPDAALSLLRTFGAPAISYLPKPGLFHEAVFALGMSLDRATTLEAVRAFTTLLIHLPAEAQAKWRVVTSSLVYGATLLDRKGFEETKRLLGPESPLWDHPQFGSILLRYPQWKSHLSSLSPRVLAESAFCRETLDRLDEDDAATPEEIHDVLMLIRDGLEQDLSLLASAYQYFGPDALDDLTRVAAGALLAATPLDDPIHQDESLWSLVMTYLVEHREEQAVQRLLHQPRFVAYWLVRNGLDQTQKLIPSGLLQDPRCWQEALKLRPSMIASLPTALRADPFFAKEILSLDQVPEDALNFFDEYLRHNRHLALLAVERHPNAIQWVDRSLWGDHEIRRCITAAESALETDVAKAYFSRMELLDAGGIPPAEMPDQLQPMPDLLKSTCPPSRSPPPEEFTLKQAFEVFRSFMGFLQQASPEALVEMTLSDEVFRDILLGVGESMKLSLPAFSSDSPLFRKRLLSVLKENQNRMSEIVHQLCAMYLSKLSEIQHNIEENRPFLGTPSEEASRSAYYQEVAGLLREVALLLSKKLKPAEVGATLQAERPLSLTDHAYWKIEWLQALSAVCRCAGGFAELEALLDQFLGAPPLSIEQFAVHLIRQQLRSLIGRLCRHDLQSVHSQAFLQEAWQPYSGLEVRHDPLGHAPVVSHSSGLSTPVDWEGAFDLQMSPSNLVEVAHAELAHDERLQQLFDTWVLDHPPEELQAVVEPQVEAQLKKIAEQYPSALKRFAEDQAAYHHLHEAAGAAFEESRAWLKERLPAEDCDRILQLESRSPGAAVGLLSKDLQSLYREHLRRAHALQNTARSFNAPWKAWGGGLEKDYSAQPPLEQVLNQQRTQLSQQLYMEGLGHLEGLYADGAPHTSRDQIARVFRVLGVFKRDAPITDGAG